MKYTLEVKDTDKLFEKIEKSKMFTSKKSVSGLSVKYNGVFTIIANPKINLIKISDTEIAVDVLPGIMLNLISAAFTVFFWALGIVGIVTSRLNTPLIILAFLLPSILWILQLVFNKEVTDQVLEELEKENTSLE